MFKKLGREAQRIGKQVEHTANHAANQVEAAANRIALDNERDRARSALASSEAAIAEVNELMAGVTGLFDKAQKIEKPDQKDLEEIKDPNVIVQFKLAEEKFETAKQLQVQLQTNLAEMQRLHQVVQKNRGILSPSNQEPVADNAIDAGRTACAAAEAANATIQTMLIQFREDSKNCTTLLDEYGRLATGGNPEAINRFLSKKNLEQQAQIRLLQEQLAQLQMQKSIPVVENQAGPAMLPQQEAAGASSASSASASNEQFKAGSRFDMDGLT